jgi:S-adenosylmethionine hydrolase
VRTVTFLSDYGVRDEFVGVVHAVLARTAPDARVIDLAHGVRRHDVLHGALLLARTLPYAPPGVHLAVVDPGVGGPRRAIALRTVHEDRLLVGPDNGLLIPAAERFGGVAEAVDVSASGWRLSPVSATFHGRDVLAPVAGRLAAGAALAEAGPALDPAALVRLDAPAARIEEGALVARVLAVDGFGNVELLASPADLDGGELPAGTQLIVRGAGDRHVLATVARTFSDAEEGEPLVLEDAGGALAIAVRGGDAAATLGVTPGDDVALAPLTGAPE